MDRGARRVGAGVGLAIGGIGAAAGIAFSVGDTWFPPTVPFLVAIVAASGAGGWLLGPAAWRARTKHSWLATVAGLGLVAVFIGDAVIVGGVVAIAAITGSPGAPGDAISLAISIVGLFLIGLIVVGPITAPFTLAAATIWALGMWLVRRRSCPAGSPQ
jgi:hypothetical protein